MKKTINFIKDRINFLFFFPFFYHIHESPQAQCERKPAEPFGHTPMGLPRPLCTCPWLFLLLWESPSAPLPQLAGWDKCWGQDGAHRTHTWVCESWCCTPGLGWGFGSEGLSWGWQHWEHSKRSGCDREPVILSSWSLRRFKPKILSLPYLWHRSWTRLLTASSCHVCTSQNLLSACRALRSSFHSPSSSRDVKSPEYHKELIVYAFRHEHVKERGWMHRGRVSLSILSLLQYIGGK